MQGQTVDIRERTPSNRYPIATMLWLDYDYLECGTAKEKEKGNNSICYPY